MLMNRRVGALAVLSCLFLPAVPGSYAQAPAPAPNLGLIKSLNCTFPLSVSTIWDAAGDPQVQVKKVPVLTFQIDEIDTQEGSARMLGVASGSHVTASLSGANLHIMDIRATGSLTITTIFGQESRDGKLKAVHTRTDYLRYSVPGFVSQPEVSQHYGECEAGR